MSSVFTALDIKNMRDLAAAATALVSWRNFAIILALINLKNLPLAWHVSFRGSPLLAQVPLFLPALVKIGFQ